jgi:hypothetical protein
MEPFASADITGTTNRTFGTLRKKLLRKYVFVMVCMLGMVAYSVVSYSSGYSSMLAYLPASASQQNSMNEDTMAMAKEEMVLVESAVAFRDGATQYVGGTSSAFAGVPNLNPSPPPKEPDTTKNLEEKVKVYYPPQKKSNITKVLAEKVKVSKPSSSPTEKEAGISNTIESKSKIDAASTSVADTKSDDSANSIGGAGTAPVSSTPVAEKSSPTDSKSSSTRTKAKQANANPLLNRDFEDVSHVVFDDLHFRRVCEEVSSSVLCLTIRYPFEAPVQNASRSFPSPVDDRFYKIDQAFILDGADLDKHCRRKEQVLNGTTTSTSTSTIDIDVRVRSCLDEYSAKQHEKFKSVAVAVFTRRTMVRDKGGAVDVVKSDFYGTGSEPQMHRARQFFNNQVIIVLGDSNGPPVTECLAKLLGNCEKQSRGSRFSCISHGEENTTSTFQVFRYEPKVRHVKDSPPEHDVTSVENLTTLIRKHVAKPEWKSIQQKEISILVEFPVAHSHTEPMLFHNMDQVEYNQVGYTQRIMSVLTSQGKRELQDINITLARITAFDGLATHFPTQTNSHRKVNATNQIEYLARNGGYTDSVWRPEYGSTCVGPLPPTNPQKRVNGFARTAFEELGLDTNFYGKTWEFTNLFWFQTRQWVKPNGGTGFIDCVHHCAFGRCVSGAYCMHRYFLQAMIDSHFETESAGSL